MYASMLLLPFVTHHLYTADMLSLLTWTDVGAIVSLNPLVSLLFLIAHFAAAVGLYRFEAWGRTLLLILIVLDVALTPLSGVTIGAPIENTVNFVVILVYGGVLAMAFLPPLAAKFREVGVSAGGESNSGDAANMSVQADRPASGR